MVTNAFKPSSADCADDLAVSPTVRTPRTSSLYGASGISSSAGRTSGSFGIESRAATITSASSLRVGPRFGSSSGSRKSLTRWGVTCASVNRATDATTHVLQYRRDGRKVTTRTRCLHKCTHDLDGRFSLALLRLAQYLDTLFAGILREALDVFAALVLGLVCGVEGLDQDLGCVQGSLFRGTVCWLEDLATCQSLTRRRLVRHTSSLRVFQSFRAWVRATEGP